MECRRFRDIADSYLAEELLVETNHEVLRHLETCPACRAELAARRGVRRALRSAFANAEELQPAGDLRERVQRFALARAAERTAEQERHEALIESETAPRAGFLKRAFRWLRETSWSGRGVGRRWIVATVLLLAGVVGGAIVSQAWGPFSEEIIATRSPTGTPTGRALMEVAPFAAGDHRECALQGKPESWVALDEAGRRFDPVYAGLADVVRRDRAATKRITIADVVDGHSCVFQGRRFGHVMLKHSGRLVSVLVTNFSVAQKSTGLARLTGRDGLRRVAACSQNADFRVACFRAPHHAVFVVSDLGEQDNLALARSVAPSLQQHLAAIAEKRASFGTSGLGDLWNYSERTTPDEVVPSALVHPSGP